MELKLKVSVVAVAFAFATGVLAEDTATMPEVVVNADKVKPLPAQSDTGLDRDGLLRRRANTSDSAMLLDGQPGVSLYGAGGVSSLPVIHGMADDRLRVKVEGMDLIPACPNHMNSPLSYIDPTSVGSIKVFAGITPVSAGGDSIGGTIMMDQAAPEFANADEGTLTKGQAGGFYRSNGGAKGVNLSATVASESVSLTYNGSTAQSGNYKSANAFKAAGAASADKPGVQLSGNEVGSTKYKAQNQSLLMAMRKDSHAVDLKLGWQHIPYELYPNQRMDMLDNKERRANLHYVGQYGWGVLDARTYRETVDHFMDFGEDKQYIYGGPLPAIVAPGMPMYTTGKNSGLQIKADIASGQQDIFRVGSDAQQYRLNDWWPPSPSSLAGMVSAPGVPATSGGMAPNTFWNINDGKRDRFGLFGEWDAHWDTQWSSLLGLRAEQVKMDAGLVQGYNTVMAGYGVSAANFNARSRQRTDNNLDLTALARYSPTDTRTIEFGYAQKTRSPNLYERYSWSQNSMALVMNNFVGDGNGYLGNPDLKPEVAHTLSATIGTNDTDHVWDFKVSPYYTRVSNYIDAIRCAGSGTGMMAICGGAANNTATGKFVQLQYANQSARLYGVDISGHMLLAKTEGWGEFSFTGLLNYVSGRNTDTGGGLYNIMPINTKLTVAEKLGGWDNRVEWVLVSAKKTVSTVRQEVKTNGYGLLNLRSSYEWKQVRLDVALENALNKMYFLPLGGAYSGQGATMSTQGIAWGVPVPGIGRSFNTGVTVKF
jgi:iron complex outermembrane receptor protein